MSRIKNTAISIKEKLESMQEVALPASQQNSMLSKQQSGKKKVTFYLDKDTEIKLSEIYGKKIIKNEKVDKSKMICDAINLLWIQENTYDRKIKNV
jgi:hypothetical protein